jgi:hypothetical protein
MRIALRLTLAGLMILGVLADSMAQTRGRPQPRSQAAPPATGSYYGTYGLSDCSQRPFARDCDKRGTW